MFQEDWKGEKSKTCGTLLQVSGLTDERCQAKREEVGFRDTFESNYTFYKDKSLVETR